MSLALKLLIISSLVAATVSQRNNQFAPGRNTIVQLFEWKWDAIAKECEGFLRDKGYGGVQTSPPNENLVVKNRPWWERYQPVSYILNTRSGDERSFADMVKRCNAAGVRIYVDAVINHMSGMGGVGTAGSTADYDNEQYPAVPYGPGDFHTPCEINNYNDAGNVRNCELVNLRDLNQVRDHEENTGVSKVNGNPSALQVCASLWETKAWGTDYVRSKIVEYLNHLVDLGVAGFRVDAAKHMWPRDLEIIFGQLNDLNVEHGFAEGARPFIYQEVIDFGGESISKDEYTDFGTVLEFQYAATLGTVFQRGERLASLYNFGTDPKWHLVDGINAVAFIDNHDNQRSDNTINLTYKKSKPYKMATAFMLAHPYGTTKVMSSFDFTNFDQGPPQDSSGNLISPGFNEDNTCTNGYVCEHRWREISNMVVFRNVVEGTTISGWWSDNNNQIAFSRGNKGFVAFTQEGDIGQKLSTKLPSGTYCDVISGDLVDGECTGKTVQVDEEGDAFISLGDEEFDGVLAIHVEAKLL